MADQKTIETAHYEVVEAREIAGEWREKGKVITLPVKQAKYLTAPYSGVLKPAKGRKAKADT